MKSFKPFELINFVNLLQLEWGTLDKAPIDKTSSFLITKGISEMITNPDELNG